MPSHTRGRQREGGGGCTATGEVVGGPPVHLQTPSTRVVRADIGGRESRGAHVRARGSDLPSREEYPDAEDRLDAFIQRVFGLETLADAWCLCLDHHLSNARLQELIAAMEREELTPHELMALFPKFPAWHSRLVSAR